MEWTYWTQTVSVYSVNGAIWNGLTGHSECVQCKWCDMECTGHSECIQCKWCDMEWTYWTQAVSVYSVNGVIWNVLDTDSECVQCKRCDM